MIDIHLDMFQTAGLGALALVLGKWLNGRIRFLQRYCVPSPVSGGLLFSLLSLSLYSIFGVEISFDGTLKDAMMLAFFTSVGFHADLKMIRSGGRPLLTMLVLVAILVVIQNIIPLFLTSIMNVDPLVGMAAGSVSMTGGHGTAGGFSPLLEDMGLHGAGTIAMAAATFGLVAGSMVGGPLADRLIRGKLCGDRSLITETEADDTHSGGSRAHSGGKQKAGAEEYAIAACCIVIVMAGGTLVSSLLSKTGGTFPTYFGALVLAVAVRNILGAFPEQSKHLPVDKITDLGNICLALFLGMAMISLRLWELSSLALPLLAILLVQVAIIWLFGYFVAFRALGKDFDAAVMVAGLCGFGLGATPNAMANMSAVCGKYRYSAKAFLIVPIVGAMFSDLVNTGIITLFLNWIR